MAVTIPLRNDVPVQSLQVELDGRTYGLEVRWNFRAGQWALSIFDAENVTLVANVGITVDYPLGRRVQKDGMPPGVFIAKDTSGEHREAEFADLGQRVQLLYLSRNEILGA